MFGFFKNLLRRPLSSQADPGSNGGTEAVAAPPPYYPEPAPRPATPRKGSAQPVQSGKGIDVPLQSILRSLPLELQPKVRLPDVGDLTISIPLERILAQLSRGAVKISFGELRQAVPEVFTAENDRDRVLVALPLAEILSRLNPALITRRRAQRQVEVPAEIASPFDAHGEGLVFSVSPGKPEAPKPATPLAPRHTTPASSPVSSLPGRMSLGAQPAHPAPGGAPPVASARLNLTTAPSPTPPPSLSKPAAPAPPPIVPMTKQPPASTKAPPPPVVPVSHPLAERPQKPISIGAQGHSGPDLPKAASPMRTPPAAPVQAVSPTPAPAKPAGNGELLTVALTAIGEGWPEAIRKEIIDMNLVEAKVALPAVAVEQALKQGRISFSWKTLRSWIKPAVLPAVSAHDSSVLELPLKVVAPLFLARQREAAKPHQKVVIDEDIPNLFFGFPQAETPVPVAQATARPTDTNYYVWEDGGEMVKEMGEETKRPSPGTKFVAKYATPNEVVSRAAALDGVAGVLIALPDGLMVANHLPAEVNADTMAAFLPQIFGKVSQCTKELRMGELNNLNFTVGNIPWKIFRVNAIFFAAFGRAGEPLPTAQLAALAAELDHKPK